MKMLFKMRFALGLLFVSIATAEVEDSAVTDQSSHHRKRELRTIFCRCVADFETFYDRRRQLKSYFHYDGDLPTSATVAPSMAEQQSLRTKSSKYFSKEGYYGKESRQGSSDAIEGPDGFFIVEGITVLPLDDEACIVSQTNASLRSFLQLLFRPRNQANGRSKGISSFSSLFQNRNRRSLLSDDLEQHHEEQKENDYDISERELQGWGERRKNKPRKPTGSRGMSLRDKEVQDILDEDLREHVPGNVDGVQPRPQPSPSGYPRVFPCPPVKATDAPTAAPAKSAPTLSPSVIDPPVNETDQPMISVQPTMTTIEPTISPEPTITPTSEEEASSEPSISPIPTVVPSSEIEVTSMPSGSPSIPPSLTLPPSFSPSTSPKPTVSAVPTNFITLEPTDSKAPTISPMPSVNPTTSISPSSKTQEPSTSNPPTVLPSILPSVDPTVSEFPTISSAPTISPKPNIDATLAPSFSPNIEPTFSQAPTLSGMPSLEPSFSDRPSGVPSFPPSFSPTITGLPTSPPSINIVDSLARLRPKNNLCDAAVSLPMDGSPFPGTTSFGTNEVDYGCNITGGIQTSISPGVWFTATGNGNIYEVSTCSDRTNFGTAIQVLVGGCEDLQCLHNSGRIFDRACSETNSDEWNRLGTRVRIETIPDEMYSFLVLSRLREHTGNFDIHLEEIVTPPNDRCDGASLVVVDVPRLHIGTTLSATIGTNYGCGSSSLGVNNAAPGIWYIAVGNGDTFSASTCTQWTNFDTAIQVFTGSSCDKLTCMAGSMTDSCSVTSGSSTVSFPTILGESYYIYVFGRQRNDTGTFILTLTSYDPTV